MNKHFVAILGAVSLVFTAGVASSSPSASADLALNPDRLYMAWEAPSGDVNYIAFPPNTASSPLYLPCDVTLFSQGLDIDYPAATGPVVYPTVDYHFFNQSGQALVSHGCNDASPAGFSEADLEGAAMTPGTVQSDGSMPVDAGGNFCASQFQPGDLPANELVKMHLNLTGYSDAARTKLVSDPRPSNNTMDVWLIRQCAIAG